jgi:dipeptidyl-peptidase-4
VDLASFPAQAARTQRFSLGAPRSFVLSPDGARLLFLRSLGPEDRTGCLWLLEGGEERLLADPDELRDAGDAVPEAELVRRERTREQSTGIVAYAADAQLRVVVFAVNGSLWAVEVASGELRRVPALEPVVDPRLDPTGQRVAYVSDRDLRVTELASGRDWLVSDPADSSNDEVTWGLAEHEATESMHRDRGHWWSPDGAKLLAARVDVSRVQRWWIADPADPARPPRQIIYPVAGTANAEVSLQVLGLDGARVDVAWDRAAFEYLPSASWDAHGPLISVQTRDQRTLRVLAVDPVTGATSLLHEQRDPAWVQLIPGIPARTAAGLLVHAQDSASTRALLVGGQVVTPEGLQLLQVIAVTGESVLFVASEEPTQEHLWVHEEGSLRRLSDQTGVHTGQRSGDVLLLDSLTDDGHEVRVRRGASSVRLRDLAAVSTVIPRVTWLRSGASEIRTALLLPSGHRPGSGSLPVLMCPYGGPAGLQVLHGQFHWLREAQWFAEAGFAVVIADGRGTPGRGPAWEKTVHGDTLSYPLADQVTALQATAGQYQDLDLSRVGIRGWSFGGTLAAAAVLRHPDVFHAAVAGAPVTDQRLYDTHWRERFLGHPDQEPEAYDRSSLLLDAPNLRRPLLLIHGLADDNVVPANTLRLSAALLAAGRPHRVLPLPATTHRPTSEPVMAGLLLAQLAFFAETLGLENPASG